MAESSTPSGRPRFPAALTIVLVVAVLYFARQVFIPIALAVLLTFLLGPLVRRLERLRIPRVPAVLGVVALVAVFVAGLGWVVQGQIVELAGTLPAYKANIARKLEDLRLSTRGALSEAGRTLAELEKEITEPEEAATGAPEPAPEPQPVVVVPPPASPLTYARTILLPMLAPVATAGLVIVFVIFMLINREDLRDRIIRLVGERGIHQTTQAFDDAMQRVSRYLLMQLIANGSAGAALGIGLSLLGVPNAALWGLLGALLRFIPYLGAWIAALLPIATSVAVSPDWGQPLMVVVLIVVIEVITNNVVEPLLYGSGTGLSPMAILIAAVFWTWLWGGIGLLLATPLTVCLAVIGRHVANLRFLDVMLGDEPVLPPEARFYQRLLAGDQDEAARVLAAFAKERAPAEVLDGLVLPAMRMAETDRHQGNLDPDRDRYVRDMLAIVSEDLADQAASPKAPAGGPRAGLVLCVPARDEADELAAEILARLLSEAGVPAEVVSAQALSGEALEAVGERRPAAVCVSALPPRAMLHARVLCKRLRGRAPEVPIVVGYWDSRIDDQTAQQRIELGGSERVVTTLGRAVEQLRSLAAALHQAEPVVTTRVGNGRLSKRPRR